MTDSPIIASKRTQLRQMKRQVRWHRRWVVALLVVELLALSAFLIYQNEARYQGTPPPTVQVP